MIYLKEYKKYLSDNNYSQTAIKSYSVGVQSFFTFLKNNNLNINNLSVNDFNNYIDNLNFSNNTKSVYANGVKNYLYFIKDKYNFKLSFNLQKIKQIKKSKKIKNDIDLNLLNSVLKKLKNSSKLSDLRDFLIISLITKTGIKVSELILINRNNVVDNKITHNGQNFLIDKELFFLLENLIIRSKPDFKYLFSPLSANTKLSNSHITTRSIETIIKKYFPKNNYNDLKNLYFKLLIEDLPNITNVHCHFSNDYKIKVNNLVDII